MLLNARLLLNKAPLPITAAKDGLSTVAFDKSSHWCDSGAKPCQTLEINGKAYAVKVWENQNQPGFCLSGLLPHTIGIGKPVEWIYKAVNLPVAGYHGTNFCNLTGEVEKNGELEADQGRLYISSKEIARSYALQQSGVPVIVRVASSCFPNVNDVYGSEAHLHKHNYFPKGSTKTLLEIYWLIDRSYNPCLEERSTYLFRKSRWNPIYTKVSNSLPNLSQQEVLHAFFEDVRSQR
jgi:hypothetical protein